VNGIKDWEMCFETSTRGGGGGAVKNHIKKKKGGGIKLPNSSAYRFIVCVTTGGWRATRPLPSLPSATAGGGNLNRKKAGCLTGGPWGGAGGPKKLVLST